MLDLRDHYDKIYRFCFYKLFDKDLAEDITQETFLKYLEHYDFSSKTETLKYLYTIAGNLCIDEFRKKKPESEENIPELIFEDNTVEKMSIRNAILRLPDDERELLLLRYANEVNVNVIAKIKNISRFSVRRKLLLAKKHLEEELRKEDAYE